MGGRKAFRPSALARELADLGAVSVGAAGTFVFHGAIGPAALRARILESLPFQAEVMVCSSREVLALAAGDPFSGEPAGKDVKRYVTVLSTRPRALLPIPFSRPDGREWQVKVIGVSGRFVLSLARRLGRALLYPNEVVEKTLGVPGTTRNWSTISAIQDILASR